MPKCSVWLLVAAFTCGAICQSQAKPSRPSPALVLAVRALVPQNKNEIERLRRQNIGWEALRDSLIQNGASQTEADGVIKRARRAMAHPPLYMERKALWPIFARRMSLGASPVWAIEAATPTTHFLYCSTGMSAEQIAQIHARNKERCYQRVVIIEARAPFRRLSFFDSMD